MSDILDKLNAAIGYQTNKELPSALLITKNAYAKTRRFGQLLDEKAGKSYEWYTFPLAVKDSDFVIRDIIFPKEQTISSAHVGVSGREVALASSEVTQLNKQNNTKNYVIGWTHSHANFSPFHSGTDERNILDVLNSVSLNTEFVNYKDFKVIHSKPKKEFKDSQLLIKGQDAEDGLINIDYDPKIMAELIKNSGFEKDHDKLEKLVNEVLKLGNVGFKMPIITGFCYSLVVNNIKAPPDCRIAVIEEELLTGRKNEYQKKVPIKIVKVENDITFTDDELNKIIDERVDIPKSFFQTIFGPDDKDEHKKDKTPKTKIEDHTKYQPAAADKRLDVTVENTVVKKEKPKISDDKLIDEFCNKAWSDAYQVYGASEYKCDVVIGTILGNKNIESVNDIDDVEFRKHGYSSINFIPSVTLERKNEFKEIITGYVKKGNTKLTDFMREYIDEDKYNYMRREKLLKIGLTVIDDSADLKDMLSGHKDTKENTAENITNKVVPVDTTNGTFADNRNADLEHWEKLYEVAGENLQKNGVVQDDDKNKPEEDKKSYDPNNNVII